MEDHFSAEQLAQLKTVFDESIREAFANVGLRIDDGDEVDEARKDFSFVRYLRQAGSRTAQKVGWAVIFALLSGLLYIVKLGFDTYLMTRGHTP